MRQRAKRILVCVGAAAAAMVMAMIMTMVMTSSAFADSDSLVGPAPETIIGAASFYDDPGETASGEQYDPKAFTAAAQLDIRDKFGGIKFGSLYRVVFAIAEYSGKKLILKFNDVGPLRPGRKFDLSRAAMEYFDGIDKGVLPDVKVTVLPLGQAFRPGPVTDYELAAMGIGKTNVADAGSADARGSNTEEGVTQSAAAAIDTLSAAAVPTVTCVDLARTCEEPSSAVAQSEPPATTSKSTEPADAKFASATTPVADHDRWQVIERWSAASDPRNIGEDGGCSAGGC